MIRRSSSIALVLFLFAASFGACRAWGSVPVNVVRSPFSPNGDAVHDTAYVAWRLTDDAVSVRVEVRAGAAVLRAFDLGPQSAGTDTLAWDGRNGSGVVQSDGLYTFAVKTQNAVSDSGFASVVLDVTPPSLPFFDPDFDGSERTDSTLSITANAPGADSVVIYRDGVPFDTLAVDPVDHLAGRSVTLTEGLTAFALRGTDRAGNTSALSVASSVHYRNSADVLGLRVSPTRFSPDGDDVLDSTRVTFRLDAPTSRLALQIRQAIQSGSGLTIADSLPYVRLYDGTALPGSYVFEWEGYDSLGAPAPEGTYFAYVLAESTTAAGDPAPGSERTVRIDLDLTPPGTPVLTVPFPERITRNTFSIAGSVPNGDSVYVIRSGFVIARSGGVFNLTLGALPGENTFFLQGLDLAGLRSPMIGPFTVSYEELLGFHAPERFRGGDVFEVNSISSPRSIRIELFTLSGRLVRVLLASAPSTRAELPWDLLDQQGREVGNGPYVVRLTVVGSDGSQNQKTTAVVVAK